MTESEGELSAEDVQALLDRIHEGADLAAKIASLRPDGAKMHEILSLYCSLFTTTVDYQQVIHVPEDVRTQEHDYLNSLWYPSTSSVGHADLQWAAQLDGDWDDNPIRIGVNLVRRMVAAAIDHMLGTSTLIGVTNLARSPIAAARAGMEACATAAFMIDAEVTREERARRSINLRLQALEERRRNSTDQLQSDVHSEIESLVSAAQAAGFDVRWKPGKGFPGIPNSQGKGDAATWMIGELLERNHDLGESFYRSMSGATHSKDEVTLLLMESWSGYPNAATRDRDVAFSTVGSVLAFTELPKRLASYLGWEMDQMTEPGDGLRQIWLVAGGMFDHELKKHVD